MMHYFQHIKSLMLHMYLVLPHILKWEGSLMCSTSFITRQLPFTISAAMQDTHTVEHVEHLLTSKSTPQMCKSPTLHFQHRYVHSSLILWPMAGGEFSSWVPPTMCTWLAVPSPLPPAMKRPYTIWRLTRWVRDNCQVKPLMCIDFKEGSHLILAHETSVMKVVSPCSCAGYECSTGGNTYNE